MDRPRAGFVRFVEVNTPRDLIEKKCGEAASSTSSSSV
jgi:hypothetical protein